MHPIFLRAANRLLRRISRKHENIHIEREDGSLIAVSYYKAEGKRPLLLYIHGGGFCFSTPPMCFKEMRRYSSSLNMNVAMPNYITSDEKGYPYPFIDVKETLLHFIRNKEKYNLTDEILIAGDSAGACLASELTSYAIKHGITITRLLLIYPVISDEMKSDSMKRFRTAPIWNSRLTEKMWTLYLRDGKGEYAVASEIDNLPSFPRTFIEVEEYDCLRDEGIEFAENLKENGVQVTLLKNRMSYHGFDYFKETPLVLRSKKMRTDFLRG